MVRSVYVGLFVLGALGGVAFADGDAAWDGTYSREGAGGSELCPDADSLTVAHGAFSLVWTIRYNNARLFRVGKIDGTIGASGTVKVNATVFSPLAAETRTALEAMGDKVDDLKTVAAEMKIRVQAKPKRRISLASGFCYASWEGGEVTANDDQANEAAAAAPIAKPSKKAKSTAKQPVAKKSAKTAPPARTKPAAVATSRSLTAKSKTLSTPRVSAPKASASKSSGSSGSSSSRPSSSSSSASESKPPPKPNLNLKPGAKCDEDEDCESDTCTFGQCYGRHGKPEFVSGSRCMHDEDCASGECHDTCR